MRTITGCRVCGNEFDSILNLGDLYVSDFPKPGDPEGTKGPLELVLCQHCKLLQLKHTVSAESMYRNYWYRSGINQTMRTALADIANKAEKLVKLKSNEVVLDIGANDGTLLDSYKTWDIYKIGFDPAENLKQYSENVADRIVVDFFTREKYDQNFDERIQDPMIVTSIAMFYDLDDPRKFVSDVREVMHRDGLWIIQLSYTPLMLKTNELGNVCHEHLEYYTLASIEYLLDLYDMKVVDVETNDINGGSFRVYVRKMGSDDNRFGDETYRSLAKERVAAMRRQEAGLGLGTRRPYDEFAWWVDRIRDDVVKKINEINHFGEKVYIYGASTKGNTLLQYYELDNEDIVAAVERNPDKWGRVTIGTNIPIISEEQARKECPDYFLVLPWHFVEEFKVREIEWLKQGGRFIMPAPHYSLI